MENKETNVDKVEPVKENKMMKWIIWILLIVAVVAVVVVVWMFWQKKTPQDIISSVSGLIKPQEEAAATIKMIEGGFF